MTTRDRLPLAGLRTGAFGKGGAGKTTVLVFLARALRSQGYEVAILDADSTNLGLHTALGLSTPPSDLIDLFGGMIFSGGSVTCPVDDPTPLPHSTISLRDLPGDYHRLTEDGIHLLTAGKMGGRGPGAGCDGPILKIARDLHITELGEKGIILIDLKAGLEDSARGMVASLDWVLAVVDPTIAAIQIAIHLDRVVKQVRAGTQPATAHLEDADLVDIARRLYQQSEVRGVRAVINKVSDSEVEDHIREALTGEGVKILGMIPEADSIPASWLSGHVLDAPEADRAALEIVQSLESQHVSTGVPSVHTRVRQYREPGAPERAAKG